MRNFNWLLLAVRLLGVRSARYSPRIPPLLRISRTVVLLYNLFRLGIPLVEPYRADRHPVHTSLVSETIFGFL